MEDRTIDERLEFLLKSTETLHEDCRELYRTTEKLTTVAERHQEQWELHQQEFERFRRAIRAGLEEYFGDNGKESEQ